MNALIKRVVIRRIELPPIDQAALGLRKQRKSSLTFYRGDFAHFVDCGLRLRSVIDRVHGEEIDADESV
jgi:hypothetical protein